MTGISLDYYFVGGSNTSGGTTTYTQIIGASTQPVGPTSTPSGDFLILNLTLKQAAASNYSIHQPTLSDSANTWTLLDWDTTENTGGIWICDNANPCSTITFGSCGAKAVWLVSVVAFGGISTASSTVVDKKIMGAGSGSYPASGLSATTTNPGDLWVGAINIIESGTGGTLTGPGSPWLDLGGIGMNSTNGEYFARCWLGYQVPGSVGQLSVSGSGGSYFSAFAFALQPSALAVTPATVAGPAATAASTAQAGTVTYGWTQAGVPAVSSVTGVAGSVSPGYGVSTTGVVSPNTATAPDGTMLTGTGPAPIAAPAAYVTAYAVAGIASISEANIYGPPGHAAAAAINGSVEADTQSSQVNGPTVNAGNISPPGIVSGTSVTYGVTPGVTVTAHTGTIIAGGGTTVVITIVPRVAVAAFGGVVTINPGSGAFIQNLCTNPSFEVSRAGWTTLPGTTVTTTATQAVYGIDSLQVITDGLQAGEGVYGPQVPVPVTGPACMSVYLKGTGSVQVAAVSNPGGVLLGSTIVQLTAPWQRVELNNLAVTSTEQMYLLIQTPFAQDVQFYVDAAQYEMVATASEYVDGDQTQSQWEGVPGLSASFRLFQFMLSLRGGLYISGYAACIVQGEVFPEGMAGPVVISGTPLVAVAGIPAGAFDDFAMFELNDVDPAMTYVSWNNANTPSGQTTYTENYAIFHPPLDYPTSDPENAWNRAAYMATGFEFVNVPAGQAQNITQVQVTQMPLVNNNDATPLPLAYDSPRAIHTIIHPTRLNYCPNPSIEAAITGWTGTSATVTRDTTTGLDITGIEARPPFLANTGTNTIVDSPANTVSVGDVVTASLWVYAPGALSQDMQLQLSWRDSLNNVLSTSVPSLVYAVPATWTEVTVTGTAPSGAYFFTAELTYVETPLATDIVYVDTLAITVTTGAPGNVFSDPGFNNGTDGWSGLQTLGGGYVYLGGEHFTSGTATSPATPASAYSTWQGSISASTYFDSTGTAQAGIQWLNASSGVISTTYGSALSIPTGSYVTVTVSGTAPAGTVSAKLVLVTAGITAGSGSQSTGALVTSAFLGSTGWLSGSNFDSGSGTIAGWTINAVGGTLALSAVYAQSGTHSMVVTPSGLTVVPWSSTPSAMKVVPASAAGTAQITVPYLIVGDTYIASCYVFAGAGIAGAAVTIGNGTITDSGTAPDEYAAMGWQRYWVMFTAQQSTVTMIITHVPGAGITYGTSAYWVDDIMLEAGEVLGDYFDGGVADGDHNWETGGTAELTRSYYYQNYAIKQATVADILARHTPIGLTCLPPVYNLPYTQ